jgi:hypothetical protein
MKKIGYLSIIFVIFIFQVCINFEILNKSRVIRVCDEAQRILYSREVYQTLFTPNPSLSSKTDFFFSLDTNQGHPHLLEFTEALSWKAIDTLKINNWPFNENLLILITNSFFLLILLLSIYGAGTLLYDEKTGLLAAFFTSMFPLVFGQARNSMLDLPLMAMVSLSIWAVLKSNRFHSVFYSLLAGALCGLAQLTKETAFIFICFPVLFYLIKSYLASKDRRVILNFLLTLAAFAAVAGAVYFRPENFHVFKNYAHKIFGIYNNANFRYYLQTSHHILGPNITILSLPLLLSYLVNFRKRDKFVFCWLIIPLILFSLSQNKVPRFIMPILPAFSLLISAEILQLKFSRSAKKIICGCYVLIAFLQYTFFNYGILKSNPEEKHSGYPSVEDPYFTMEHGITAAREDPYLNDALKLLAVFKNEAPFSENLQKPSIYILFNIPQFHYFLVLNGLNIYPPLEADQAYVQKRHFEYYNISQADYVVIENEDTYPVPSHVKKLADHLRQNFLKNQGNFKKIADFRSSDGHHICIYRNRHLNK